MGQRSGRGAELLGFHLRPILVCIIVSGVSLTMSTYSISRLLKGIFGKLVLLWSLHSALHSEQSLPCVCHGVSTNGVHLCDSRCVSCCLCCPGGPGSCPCSPFCVWTSICFCLSCVWLSPHCVRPNVPPSVSLAHFHQTQNVQFDYNSGNQTGQTTTV